MRTYSCTISRTRAYMEKRKTLDLTIGTKEESLICYEINVFSYEGVI